MKVVAKYGKRFFNMPAKSVMLLLVLFGCVLSINPALIDYSLIPRQLFVSFLTLAFLAGLVVTKQFRINATKASITALYLLVLWLLGCLFSYSSSIVTAEYINEIARVSIYIGFFVCCLATRKDAILPVSLARLTSIVSIFLGIIGGAQLLAYKPSFTIDGMMAITGLMSNKNIFSEYLAMLIPLVLFGIFTDTGKWRLIHIVAALLSLLFILVLMARSSWFALVLAGCLVVLFTVGKTELLKRSKFKVWYLPLVLVVLIFGVNWITDGAILNRLSTLANYQSGSSGFRLTIWGHTLNMIGDSPFFGIGAGNWKVLFQQYSPSNDLDTFTTQTLNDYLSVFSESGILGFLGYTGMVVFGLACSISSSFKQSDNRSAYHLAIACSILVYATISFFNFPKNRVEHFIFFLFLVWQATSLSYSKTISLRFNLVYYVLVIGLSFSTWWFLERFSSELHLRKALELRKNKNWTGVIDELSDISYSIYPLEPTTTPVAWYKGIAHFELKQYQMALKEFEFAYTFNPFHVHVLNNLGTSYEIHQKHKEAITCFKQALTLNPYFNDALLNLIAVYYNQGQYQQALELIDDSKLNHLNSVKNYRNIVARQKNKSVENRN